MSLPPAHHEPGEFSSTPYSAFAVNTNPIHRTAQCLYRDLTTIWDAELTSELRPVFPADCNAAQLKHVSQQSVATFDGLWYTSWTSLHWEVPLLACAAYLLMIWRLPRWMSDRPPIRLQPVVIVWNFGLSLFSLAGMYFCIPHLLVGPSGLLTQGFYTSVCDHAVSYGNDWVGLFVFLFVYSKLAELVDTLWLLLRKTDVILLHWYHHITVLLYCWHAYSVRIGTGLWFATMNYTVHTIMYFYFGLTQIGPAGRRAAKRFAMLVTLLQLAQMVVGIVVTVGSVVYHAHGQPCYVSPTNSALGLIMYTSYFVLFLQLFLSHYVYKKARLDKRVGEFVPSCPPEVTEASEAVMRGKPPTVLPVHVLEVKGE